MIVVKRVRVDLEPLKKFRTMVNGQANAWRPMLTQLVARYAAFIRRRFVEQSAGGGEWPPLAVSTIARRRKTFRGLAQRRRKELHRMELLRQRLRRKG